MLIMNQLKSKTIMFPQSFPKDNINDVCSSKIEYIYVYSSLFNSHTLIVHIRIGRYGTKNNAITTNNSGNNEYPITPTVWEKLTSPPNARVKIKIINDPTSHTVNTQLIALNYTISLTSSIPSIHTHQIDYLQQARIHTTK